MQISCESPVFHSSLPKYLSDDIERVQKRAMRKIFPSLSYNDAKAGLRHYTTDRNPYLEECRTRQTQLIGGENFLYKGDKRVKERN